MAAKSNVERQAAYRARRSRDSRAPQSWLDDADKLHRDPGSLCETVDHQTDPGLAHRQRVVLGCQG